MTVLRQPRTTGVGLCTLVRFPSYLCTRMESILVSRPLQVKEFRSQSRIAATGAGHAARALPEVALRSEVSACDSATIAPYALKEVV